MLEQIINLKIAKSFHSWPADKLNELAKFMLEGLLTDGYSQEMTIIKSQDWDDYISILKEVVKKNPLPTPVELEPF